MDKISMSSSYKNKRKNPLRNIVNAGFAFLSLSVAGCMDLYEPPTVNESRIQVKEEAYIKDIAVSDVNDALLGSIARNYAKHGGSPMDILVTYDPRSYRNTAMMATNVAADIASSLRDYGVTNVKAGVMPIKSQGDDARVLITYDSFTAQAPEGCDYDMPGISGESALENDQKYKIGCGIDTLLARQIARPADLLGRGAQENTSDGRPITNKVDLYRTGELNKPLEGESSTDE